MRYCFLPAGGRIGGGGKGCGYGRREEGGEGRLLSAERKGKEENGSTAGTELYVDGII